MIAKLVEPTRTRFAVLVALLVVVAGVVAALLSQRPPEPVPASAPAQQFSAERAVGYLEEFATEPRPLGSAASDRTRDYLADVLRSAGLSVRIERGIGGRTVEGYAGFGLVDNIVAILPGRDPTGAVLLVAHYDSVTAGPGASDDAAAVAAMLETVRAVRAGQPLRNDLGLVITDGEEAGLLGAEAFVRSNPPAGQRAVVLNWEARGASGPSLMFETSPDNAALVEVFADAAPYPHGDSSLVEIYRLLPNDTDLTEFLGAGLPGLNFAYVEDPARYHTPGDTIANLDRASLQHHGANMLGLARALGNIDLATLDTDHDATYFRFLGLLVTYPNALVWPLALLAVAALGALVALARWRQLLSLPRLALGVVAVLLPIATSAALAQGLWWVLLQLRPDYANTTFLHRPGLFQAAIVVLAALAVVVWYLVLRRRVGPAALGCGWLVWAALLGVLTAWAAPGTSFLFTLPALGWAGGGLLAVMARHSIWSVVAMAAGTVPAVVLLLPLGLNSFAVGGLAEGWLVAALLALFGLVLLPLGELLLPPPAQRLGRGPAVAVPVTGVLLVLALAGAGLVADRPDAWHPRPADLAYVLDADTGRATWISRDTAPAAWARRYVTTRAASAPAGLSDGGFAEGPVWTGPAPAVRAPAPELTVRSHTGDELTLHVASRRSAPTVVLRIDHRVEQVTVTAPGLAPLTRTLDGTMPGPWPTEIRFDDLPASGIDLTLRVPHEDLVRIVAYDLTDGLAGIPGFVPRPPDVERGRGSDAVVSTRTYTIEAAAR
ncbi:MAG: M28 family peptidase [Actinomycetota bacterium]|nr:M28 family peptidase [Actinomycetota bacterium]